MATSFNIHRLHHPINTLKQTHHSLKSFHHSPTFTNTTFQKKFPLNSSSIYAFTTRSISYSSISRPFTLNTVHNHSSIPFIIKRNYSKTRGFSTFINNYNTRATLRWLGYWSPRIVIIIWAVTFMGCGAYLLKKSIETDGFSSSYDPGTGGDVGKEDWTMIDHNGELLSKEDLSGKYCLIYFGFTFCPDVCPVEMEKLAAIADILDERGIGLDVVQPVFVSVDWRRDTPEMIKNYIKQFTKGDDKKILGLVGTKQQMEHFAKVMKTYFSAPPKLEEDYILEHSTYMYFTGMDGEFKNLTNTEDGPEVLANKVSLWIATEKGRVSKITEQVKQVFR